MKKFSVIVSFLLFALAAPAFAAQQVLPSTDIAGVVPVCGGSSPDARGLFNTTATSRVYDISTLDIINVHVYSASTSSATVVIEEAPSTAGPWGVVATITDPASTEIGWSVPRANFVRVRVSAYSSGNIYACIAGWALKAAQY